MRRPSATITGSHRKIPMQRINDFFLLALISVLVAACGKPSRPVEILFEVRFDGAPISCVSSPEDRALTDLRFYVHDIVLTMADGSKEQLRLTADTQWQSPEVALLDFEDGSGACINGTSSVNTSIRGMIAAPASGVAKGLSFAIGVPEVLNHADPMTASAPLNYTVMHWHWRSGYKFMRAGLENGDDLAWLHLGSSKCTGTLTEIEGCAAANRPTVILPEFDLATDRVVIDVARLFGPTLLGDGEPWSCESGPGEFHCRVVFAELGLEFDSGETIGPAPVFFAERRP